MNVIINSDEICTFVLKKYKSLPSNISTWKKNRSGLYFIIINKLTKIPPNIYNLLQSYKQINAQIVILADCIESIPTHILNKTEYLYFTSKDADQIWEYYGECFPYKEYKIFVESCKYCMIDSTKIGYKKTLDEFKI